MKRAMQRFWVKMFWLSVRRMPWKRRSAVGARTTVELSTGNTQVTLVVWDLTYPKYSTTYSREELVNMLGVIQCCERQMGWKVPEPEKDQTADVATMTEGRG